ncbi:MAG: type II secretion system F family protein [Coriobacteriia bacterium]|nr:type II secretion system F family protein [Coriobacteriia bacterium]
MDFSLASWFDDWRPLLALLLAAITGVLAVNPLVDWWQSKRRRLAAKARATGDGGGPGRLDKSGLATELLRNGLPVLRRLSQRLLAISQVRALVASLQAAMESRGQKATPHVVVELIMLLSAMIALVVGFLTHQVVLAVGLAVAWPWLLKNWSAKQARKRKELLRLQLPDALQSLAFSLQAGYSLSQALQQSAEECADPLAAELAQASADVRSGKSVPEALSWLEQRVGLEEMSFLTAALEIQHRTGGSLKDLLDSASAAIRSSVDLQRQLEVQTAQARLSFRVVSLMPWVLVGVLSLVMKGYLASFFSSLGGFMILLVAVALEAFGVLLIKRILKVDLT